MRPGEGIHSCVDRLPQERQHGQRQGEVVQAAVRVYGERRDAAVHTSGRCALYGKGLLVQLGV